MKHREYISCGILGGQEKDLNVLSELHKHENIRIAFIFDQDAASIGLEIAEILGIKRITNIDLLEPSEDLDYIIVSEPRERFNEALRRLSAPGLRVLGAKEAVAALCPREEPARISERPPYSERYSIEDALQALEKLFDKKELLKFLLDVAVQSAGATAGSIMLYSAEAMELYIGYAIGLSERIIKNTRQKMGEGIAGKIALEKKAKLIQLRPDQALYPSERERVDIASAICVPLLWEGKLLGILNVSTSTGENLLDDKDFEKLKRISRRISRVLFESLKVQEVQIRHQEQNLRTTVGQLIEKPVSFQEKIFLLSSYLSELLGIDNVEIYLNTHEGDWFLLGGSNNRFASQTEKVRCKKGALSRCFLEQHPIIFTELSEKESDLAAAHSSFVYYPLSLSAPLGVLVAEFSERYRLEEFLTAKDSIGLEISKFILSEIRSKKMQRELDAVAKIAEAAPALLSCRTTYELSEAIAMTITRALECMRVSVRLRAEHEDNSYTSAFFQLEENSSDGWQDDDEKIFLKLLKNKEPYSEAFLSFEPQMGRAMKPYSSLLAIPVLKGDEFRGAIIAYDKRPKDPLEEAVFSDHDQNIVERALTLAMPILDAVARQEPIEKTPVEDSYGELLKENRDGLVKTCTREIERSERYHYSFTLIIFKIAPLNLLFEENYTEALQLVEEITKGIRTRTRKTDYFSWISKDSFSLLSLEGGTRVRFLISRVLVYLTKDLTVFSKGKWDKESLMLGHTTYPGTAKTADDLFREAEQNLKPQDRE